MLTLAQLTTLVLKRWAPFTNGRADKLIWEFAVSPERRDPHDPHDPRVQDRLMIPHVFVTILAVGSLKELAPTFSMEASKCISDVVEQIGVHIPRMKTSIVYLFDEDDVEFQHPHERHTPLQTLTQDAITFVLLRGTLWSKEHSAADVTSEKMVGHRMLWHPKKPLLYRINSQGIVVIHDADKCKRHWRNCN